MNGVPLRCSFGKSLGVGLALAVVPLSTALTGCTIETPSTASTKEAPAVKPDEARSDTIDLYEATKQAIGGDWEVSGQDWSDCSRAADAPGATFNLHVQRLDQPIPTSARRLVESIQKLWHDRGIQATIAVDTQLHPANYYLTFPDFGAGTAPDGYLVQFTASDKGYADFDAKSHCAAGDAYELNHSEPTRGPGGSLFESPAP